MRITKESEGKKQERKKKKRKYLRLRLQRIPLIGLRKRREHGLLVADLRVRQKRPAEDRVHQDAADAPGPLVDAGAQPGQGVAFGVPEAAADHAVAWFHLLLPREHDLFA